MKVFVGCGSAEPIREEFWESAYRVGKIIGSKGHELIFGSSDKGMMGAVYKGAKDSGGKVISVYPVEYNGFLKRVDCDELIEVESTSVQLERLVNMGDVTVILPGSFGSFSELMASIQFKKLGENDKKIYIVNIDHFYDGFLELVDRVYEEKFEYCDKDKLYTVLETVDDLEKFL